MCDEYDEFISKRCEKVLECNEEYMKLQKQMAVSLANNDIELYSELSIKMQMVLEKVVYKLAARDAIRLFS